MIQAIVHSLGNVVIALALLNFLIAIISGVYEEVNGDRDLHDVKELAALTSELDAFWAGCRKLCSAPLRLCRKCRGGQGSQAATNGRKYYVLTSADSGDQLAGLATKVESFGERLAKLESALLAVNASVQAVQEGLGERLQGVQACFGTELRKVDEAVARVDGRLLKALLKLESQVAVPASDSL